MTPAATQPRSPPIRGAARVGRHLRGDRRRSPRRPSSRLLDGVGLRLRVHEDVARAHLGELRRVARRTPSAALRRRAASRRRRRAARRSGRSGRRACPGTTPGSRRRPRAPNWATRRRRGPRPRSSGVTWSPRAVVLPAGRPARRSRAAAPARAKSADTVSLPLPVHRALTGRRDPCAMKAALSAYGCS